MCLFAVVVAVLLQLPPAVWAIVEAIANRTEVRGACARALHVRPVTQRLVV